MPKKLQSADKTVDVNIRDGPTSSSSFVVKPPVAGQKPKGVRGRKRKAPVVDTVVIGDGDGVGMAPAMSPKPRKRKSQSPESSDVVPISNGSTSSSVSHVVKPPVTRWDGKGVRGRKRKAFNIPVVDTVVIGDGDGVGMASAMAPKLRKRKLQSAESPHVVPISNGSTSSSHVVKPPVARWKGKGVRGRKKTNTSDIPVVDTIEIGDGDGGEPELCCEICAETRHPIEMIKISTGCLHSFCASCVTKHVETKILENVTDIKCPGLGCERVIEVDICRGFLEGNLLQRWGMAKCEAAFDETQKYYCPFKECSAMLIVEGEVGDSVKECECPYCHRLFCASCKVPWHWKYTCEQFQSMDVGERGNEDVLVKELAVEQKWGRCPKCKFYVERTYGCPHIICRSVIEVGICKGFLKRELLEKWERMRCEAAFTEPQKYYCPFKDCSGMLIMDGEAGDPVRLRECECPYCHRLFCASCRVPWHWKYTCEQLQSMDANNQGKDDVLLNKLARMRKWQRCPKCRFYVQRNRGCNHILCRCGFEFCYRCGGASRGSHFDCKRHLNP